MPCHQCATGTGLGGSVFECHVLSMLQPNHVKHVCPVKRELMGNGTYFQGSKMSLYFLHCIYFSHYH